MNWAVWRSFGVVVRPIGRQGRAIGFNARSIGAGTHLARDRSAKGWRPIGAGSAGRACVVPIVRLKAGERSALSRTSCAETSKIIPSVPKHFQITLSSHLNKSN